MGYKQRTTKQLRDMRPYNTAAYKRYKQQLRDFYVTCWVKDKDGQCWRRATVPDHDPPIALHPSPNDWRGQLLPMCQYHSRKQSGLVRHGKNYIPQSSREW